MQRVPQPVDSDLAGSVTSWLEEKYGNAVVQVAQDSSVEVLPGKALNYARKKAAMSGLDERRIRPMDFAGKQWFEVPSSGVQLWRNHGSQDERVTELVEGDPPFQQIAHLDGWTLVRLYDGAMGWVEDHEFSPCPAPDPAPTQMRLDPEFFCSYLESYEGVPYAWGGTTSRGVDCSGLVQRAAWQASRVWLPRHSTALLHVGDRMHVRDARRGDLLILRRVCDPAGEHAPLGHTHVAVAVSGDEVIHASRDRHSVVRERLDEFLKRYEVLGVRRLTGA